MRLIAIYTMMYRIPTVFCGKMRFQIYWWLRSPDTGYGSGAYYVRSSGDVLINNYVVISYGRKLSGHGLGWQCLLCQSVRYCRFLQRRQYLLFLRLSGHGLFRLRFVSQLFRCCWLQPQLLRQYLQFLRYIALRARVGMNLHIIPVHLVKSLVFVMVITFPMAIFLSI